MNDHVRDMRRQFNSVRVVASVVNCQADNHQEQYFWRPHQSFEAAWRPNWTDKAPPLLRTPHQHSIDPIASAELPTLAACSPFLAAHIAGHLALTHRKCWRGRWVLLIGQTGADEPQAFRDRVMEDTTQTLRWV